MPPNSKGKKLASVSATSASVTGANQGAEDQQLNRVPCIQYPVKFKKDSTEVQALLDSGSEVNAMTPAYAAVLGLHVCPTDVGA